MLNYCSKYPYIVDILNNTIKVSKDGIFLKSTHILYFVQTDSGL